MMPGSSTALREQSRHLFGTMYRIEIASTLASWKGRTVNGTQLSEATGIAYPRVQQELRRLADAGLLRRQKDSSSQTADYTIAKSVYWRLAGEIRNEFDKNQNSA